MNINTAIARRDAQTECHEIEVETSYFDPLAWIDLDDERPDEADWVETALMVDGKLVLQDEGQIDRYRDVAFDNETGAEWEVSAWRYPVIRP